MRLNLGVPHDVGNPPAASAPPSPRGNDTHSAPPGGGSPVTYGAPRAPEHSDGGSSAPGGDACDVAMDVAGEGEGEDAGVGGAGVREGGASRWTSIAAALPSPPRTAPATPSTAPRAAGVGAASGFGAPLGDIADAEAAGWLSVAFPAALSEDVDEDMQQRATVDGKTNVTRP